MSMPMPDPMDNNGSMTMQMSFVWGTDAVILFKGWPGSHDIGMYVSALVVVFLLAAVVEILSMTPSLKPRSLSPVIGALVHAFVFGVRMGLAYMVMLSVMSFNVGVFIVAVIGHAVGSFFVKYRAMQEFDQPGIGNP